MFPTSASGFRFSAPTLTNFNSCTALTPPKPSLVPHSPRQNHLLYRTHPAKTISCTAVTPPKPSLVLHSPRQNHLLYRTHPAKTISCTALTPPKPSRPNHPTPLVICSFRPNPPDLRPAAQPQLLYRTCTAQTTQPSAEPPNLVLVLHSSTHPPKKFSQEIPIRDPHKRFSRETLFSP
jgi:hypothetical protein